MLTRMRSRRAILVFAVVALASSSHAEEASPSYLCVTEQTAGFFLDKQSGAWTSTRFNPASKYIVRTIKPGDYLFYIGEPGVFLFGNIRPDAVCKKDRSCPSNMKSEECKAFMQMEKDSTMSCEGTGRGALETFLLGRKTLRFEAWDSGGYLRVPEGTNNPTIDIGACAPL